MVSRVVVRCHGCGNALVLRITVAGGHQPFVFDCPHCASEVRGVFYAEAAQRFELRSEDFEVTNSDEERPEDLVVPVNTDLPVHISFVGTRADEALITPFIHLASTLGTDVLGAVMQPVERLRALREQIFPHLRRASTHFARGDGGAVAEALRRAPGGADIHFAAEDPVNVLGVLVSALYAPFEDVQLRQNAAEEWLRTIRLARDADEAALLDLFAELQAGPLSEHRARVIDTAMGALEATDALYPGIWAEHMEGRTDLAEYRVMRDDFDTLKVRYQDIFELASRTLAFTGRVANIAYRNEVRVHADGTERSLHKALNKTTAYNREPWLADFPVAKRLYDAMKRHTRNDIGHRLVRYDFGAGALVYEDGTTENYLLFLVDYVQAVRLTHYLLDVFEVWWHAREELGLRE